MMTTIVDPNAKGYAALFIKTGCLKQPRCYVKFLPTPCKRYNNFRLCVILSILVEGAGPIPKQVMVPVGI